MAVKKAKKNSDNVLRAHDGLARDDSANAQRLLAVADGKLHYTHTWGKFLMYRDGAWHIDVKDALTSEMAKGVAVEFKKGLPPYDRRNEYSVQEHAWAKYSSQRNGIAAMVNLARGTDGIVLDHEELETNPYLFNCTNGTFDFSGVDAEHGPIFRQPDPADLLILQSPVAYDPAATCPTWDACLERWQPDEDVRRYLQMRAGACALGLHTETLDVDWGGGANGKSKFHGAVQHVLGPYAIVPHKSLLMSRRGWSEHDTIYAELFRKRGAFATETKAGESLDEESVKHLTGGDRLKGRRMREDYWEFQPTHTTVLYTNFPPVIRGTDEAIWRRVHFVPWKVTIPEAERDERLDEKLQDEAEGILKWILTGAIMYLVHGWEVPDVIRDATDEYREEQDVVGRFLRECVEVTKEESDRLYFHELQAAADQWCEEAGVSEFSPKQLADALTNAGAWQGGRVRVKQVTRTIRTMEWLGLHLPEEEDDTAVRAYDFGAMAQRHMR